MRSLTRTFFLVAISAVLSSATAPAQSLKVTLLGTGNPRPVMSRFGPSILVEAGNQKLLFDCGRGATQRLYQLKIPFTAIDALFLTHLHSDHTVGIPDLWLTGWIMDRSAPLRIWGPPGTKHMASHLQQAYAFDVHIRRDVDERFPAAGALLQAQDVKPGVIYANQGVKVTAFAVDHGPVKPAYGYRVDFAGHSVVLSGDTRYSENLIRAAMGTDVLIHEVLDPAAYSDTPNGLSAQQRQKIVAHHTTPEQAGQVFTQVKPKLAVYSHIVPPDVPDIVSHTRKTYSGPLEVGEDLMSIEVGDKITVHRPSQTPAAPAALSLPPPTGQYLVGTNIYDWVDRSRREKASKNPTDFRQLVVQVWYPTEDRSRSLSSYVPRLDSYRRIWDDSDVNVASRTVTHSYLNASPIPGRQFPVVLLSHGWQGTRSEYTSLAEDLASHGFAVFGVDHPYMGRVALPTGEVTEPTESQFHNPAEVVAYYAADLEFVLEQITKLNQGTFGGLFDLTRIAAIGHSSGFVAVSGACKLDSRIKACINIDAPGYTASDLAGLQQPLLWIRLQKADGVPAEYLKTAKNAIYELQIEGANHGSVQDWDYLEAESAAKRLSAEKMLEVIREYVAAFLSKHLSGIRSDLLDSSTNNPGIELKVNLPPPH